jgi:hypothetical protein
MNISFNPRISAVLLMSFALVFMSCKKDEDKDSSSSSNNNNNNNTTTAPTENKLSCKVDGTLYVFDQDFSAIYIEVAGIKSLSVSGTSTTGEKLTASINLWTGNTGDFLMETVQMSNYASITWTNASDDSWSCPNSVNGDTSNLVSGNFAVGYFEGNKVSGTFTGVIASSNSATTYEVTDGVFSAITIN